MDKEEKKAPPAGNDSGESKPEAPAPAAPFSFTGLQTKMKRRLSVLIWSERHAVAPPPLRFFWKWFQIAILTVRGFIDHHCALRASALTYTTFLSFVPLLAVAFSILNAIVEPDEIKTWVLELLSAQSPDATENIGSFIEKTIEDSRTVRLGGLGGLALVLISISVLATIERAMNATWNVSKGRAFSRRLVDYGSLFLIAPAMLAVGVYVTSILEASKKSPAPVVAIAEPMPEAAIETAEPLDAEPQDVSAAPVPEEADPALEAPREATAPPSTGETQVAAAPPTQAEAEGSLFLIRMTRRIRESVFRPILETLRFLVIWAAFIFVYKFVPHTRVRLSSALVGGIIGGTLWQLAQQGYVKYSVFLADARVGRVYGSAAWVLILLVWVYISWAIFLFGAEITNAHQNLLHQRRRKRVWNGTPSEKETLALRLAALLARPMLVSLDTPFRPVTVNEIADELKLSPDPIVETLDLFERAGLVSAGGENGGYVFCRSPHDVRVADILRLVRRGTLHPKEDGDGFLTKAGASLDRVIGKRTIKDLADLPIERVRTFPIK